MKRRLLSEITVEWINSIPKTINESGCWISEFKSGSNGYVRIAISGNYYMLHRLVMCLYYNIDYNDNKIETRHNTKCDKACFFHKHLRPGTSSDNRNDSVKDKTHVATRKTHCPKCGGEYKTRKIKTGWHRGEIQRECPVCIAINNMKRYH